MNKRAIIYTREQVKPGHSADKLLPFLVNIAEAADCSVVAMLHDQLMGPKGRDRRGFDILRRHIARRGCEVVIVSSLNDLATSVVELVRFIGDVGASGIDLICHAEGIRLASPTNGRLEDFCRLLSSYERNLRREAIIAGQRRSREYGIRAGRPPLPKAMQERIAKELAHGRGIRETARVCGVSPASVQLIKKATAGSLVSPG